MAAQLAAAAPAELQRLRSEAATLRERVGALSAAKVWPDGDSPSQDAGACSTACYDNHLMVLRHSSQPLIAQSPGSDTSAGAVALV